MSHAKTRAILDLSSRPYWAALPPDEKSREVERVARQLILGESAVGQLAGLIARKAGELAHAFELFLASFPSRHQAVISAQEAIQRSDVADMPDGEEGECGSQHFAELPDLSRHLLFVLERMMLPLLEDYAVAQSCP